MHRQPTRLGPNPSCPMLSGSPEHLQNLYKSYTSPTTDSRVSAPILRSESARKRAPAAPPLPPLLSRFFAQSDASLVMHHFRTVFRPFSLWSGPQYPVMHHFLGKCTVFAAAFRPSAAAPKDRPSAIEMMCRRSPQKPYETSVVRAFPPAPASQHAYMNASQIVRNFHMIQPTTTPRPARNPISPRGTAGSQS